MAGSWAGDYILDNTAVDSIDSAFDVGKDQPEPFKLDHSKAMSFTGTKVYGNGFVLTLKEGRQLLSLAEEYSRVIKPYLVGRELNEIDCKPGRFIIDFTGMEKSDAQRFPAAWTIVEERVREKRQEAPEKNMREKYWLFQRPRPELYRLLNQRGNGWVIAATSDTVAFVAVEYSEQRPVIFSHAVNVLALEGFAHFAVVQSSLHLSWARRYGSSMKGDMRYTTTDCFETFPFPAVSSRLTEIGREYYELRSAISKKGRIGLTELYQIFHNKESLDLGMNRLRALHSEMDKGVAAAYRWDDLDLGHGFHETKQGVRFTISESARREVLARLLKLNHERYAEEVAQGLHDKKGKAKRSAGARGRKAKAAPAGPSLFGDDDDEPEPAKAPASEPSDNGQPALTPRDRQATAADSEAADRPAPIEEIETDDIMAAFRQAARGRGWLGRDELLKEVSLLLGYSRLGSKIEETLRGQLRAAIRRHIIEADGAELVRGATGSLADYSLDELRDAFRSVMQKSRQYDRDDVIRALARHLGFARLSDNSRDAIKSAINSALRRGVLGYEGSVVWREE